MAGTDPRRPAMRVKNGRKWRIGTDADVAWIAGGTPPGRQITSAIPPVFDAYATIVHPDSGDASWQEHDQAVLELLRLEPASQWWWLGYLDDGGAGSVFPGAPTVTLYANWSYVLAEARPEQAITWRTPKSGPYLGSVLPDLIFPADRSWLLSTLWDDDWTCIGGSASFVDRFLRHPLLEARPVKPGEDATPPGHQAF